MNTIRKCSISILFFLITSQLIGCTAMIHNMVVSSYPTFEDTESSWPSITGNNGRLLVYWPRLPLGGFGKGGMASLKLTIDGEKSKSGSIGDQTFVFIDLKEGAHTVELSQPGPFFTTHKNTISVNIKQEEIVFLKIKPQSFDRKAERAEVVDSSEARDSLKDIYHNYKIPAAFNEQPKGSRPAL